MQSCWAKLLSLCDIASASFPEHLPPLDDCRNSTLNIAKSRPKSETLLRHPGFSSSLRLPKTSSQSSFTPRARVNSRTSGWISSALEVWDSGLEGSRLANHHRSLLQPLDTSAGVGAMSIMPRRSKLGGSDYIRRTYCISILNT